MQTLRVDFPAHCCILGSLRLYLFRTAIRLLVQNSAVIVVEAQKINGTGDNGIVPWLDCGKDVLLCQSIEYVLWIAATENRVEEPAITFAIGGSCKLLILLRVGSGFNGCQHERDTDASIRVAISTQNGDSQPMSEQEIVRNLPRNAWVFQSRCMHAELIADKRTHPGFVERNPGLHAVAKPTRDDIGVMREGVGCFAAIPPANFVLQCLWQVPVIERDKR